MAATEQIGIVVIGRNEGERLRACLESLRGQRIVYVDSGSSDHSVTLTRSYGANVVELDMARPFSAARARNEGFTRLIQIVPDLKYVQFVDGDCVVVEDWIDAAAKYLSENSTYAAVAGRLRERFPERSIYNRLCDMEWNTPVGDVDACGGIALYRAEAFAQVGRFDESVIAGEEPELCLRLRNAGWKIRRLDAEMALHDAAMTRFGQWWKRAVRGGYAYAMGAHMHGHSPARHWVKEVRSNCFWGLLVPVFALGVAWPTWGISLTLLLGYPVLAWRIIRHMRRRGFSKADSRLYAWFCVLSKFAGVQGQCRFLVGRMFSQPATIIEYKDAATVPPA